MAGPSDTSTAPAKTGGLFGRGKKDAAPAAPKAAKAKPAESARTSAPKDSLDVFVELEGNRRVAWRVSANQFEEIEVSKVAKAASFSRNEQRYSTEQALSYSQASDLALAEVGEEVRIVNASKQVKAVYASTATRVTELGPMATGPGLFLLELLLQAEREPGEEVVCGLILTGAQQSRSLAVLYHFTKNDEVAATQITVNPDNLNFVLSQFASSRRLDGENTKFVLFKNEDLLKVAGKLALYPAEAMWHGISLRRMVWGLAMGAGVAAVGSGLFAGQAYVSMTSTKSSLSSQSSAKTKVLKEIDVLLSGSVVSFARTQGMTLPKITDRAGVLWSPGAKVTVEALPAKEAYAVTLPLTRGGLVGANPSVLNRLTLANVEPFLTAQPPEGCTKDVPNISGGMNAVQISVTCENAVSPLSSYRLN